MHNNSKLSISGKLLLHCLALWNCCWWWGCSTRNLLPTQQRRNNDDGATASSSRPQPSSRRPLLAAHGFSSFSVTTTTAAAIHPSFFQQSRNLLRHIPRSTFTPTLSHSNSVVLHSSSKSDDTTVRPLEQEDETPEGDDVTWTVGNVYEDLNELEKAITLYHAEQDLLHQERLQSLDDLAQQRRPFYKDVRNNVVVPLVISWICTITIQLCTSSMPSVVVKGARMLTNLLLSVADAHFWWVYVLSPIVLRMYLSLRTWHVNRQNTRTSDVDELDWTQNLGPEYTQFVKDRPLDSQTSCHDYVVCLLEQWMSASVWMLPLAWTLSAPYRMSHERMGYPILVVAIKLAAWASLHQFPELWYQLKRTTQPRPLTGKVYAMQKLSKSLLLPWSLSLDVSRIVLLWCSNHWKQSSVVFTTLLALTGVGTFLLPQIVTPSRNNGSAARRGTRFLLASIGAALLWPIWRHWLQARAILPTLPSVISSFIPASWSQLHGPNLRAFVSMTVSGMAFLASLVHLVAWGRIVRISNCDTLSLADLEDCQLDDAESLVAKSGTTQWRWRLQWRPPQRVRIVVRQWRQRFTYWLFMQGSVQDKLRKGRSPIRHRPTILQRLAQERANNPLRPMPDRATWKDTAMQRLAQKHQADYDRGTFDDPLGIAVYKSLGIGLGFNFDYMSQLPRDQRPSLRRLQARAAKSAIRRVQELYDAAEAVRVELDAIPDVKQRQQRARELREQTQAEIQYLADKLSTLIPTDMSLTLQPEERLEKFLLTGETGEDVITQPVMVQWSRDAMSSSGSLAVQRLLETYLNMDKNQTSRNDNNDPIDDSSFPRSRDRSGDEEFLQAWSNRRRFGYKPMSDNEDGVDLVLA